MGASECYRLLNISLRWLSCRADGSSEHHRLSWPQSPRGASSASGYLPTHDRYWLLVRPNFTIPTHLDVAKRRLLFVGASDDGAQIPRFGRHAVSAEFTRISSRSRTQCRFHFSMTMSSASLICWRLQRKHLIGSCIGAGCGALHVTAHAMPKRDTPPERSRKSGGEGFRPLLRI